VKRHKWTGEQLFGIPKAKDRTMKENLLRSDIEQIKPKAGLFYSQIAQICHEANRTLCQIMGDDSQPAWDDAPKWQRDSAMNGVVAIDEGKIQGAGDSHVSWSKEKLADGWTYGEVKDPVAKTHPCLVPFDELPYHQQLKDHLFLAIATALLRN
jgi:hypothetical protein